MRVRAGLFVFYRLRERAEWEWQLPRDWIHLGWGYTRSARYPREEIFEGPEETVDAAAAALKETLEERRRDGAVVRYVVRRAYEVPVL
jgi:hypothetical protein